MKVVPRFEAHWALKLRKFFGRRRHIAEDTHLFVVVDESFATLADRGVFKTIQELAEFFYLFLASLALVKLETVDQELAISGRLKPNSIDIIFEALCHGIVVILDHDQGLERHVVTKTSIWIISDQDFEIAIFILESNSGVCVVQSSKSGVQSIVGFYKAHLTFDDRKIFNNNFCRYTGVSFDHGMPKSI
jgi:hypothetical protein